MEKETEYHRLNRLKDKYHTYYAEWVDWKCPECGANKPVYKYYVNGEGILKGFYVHCSQCSYRKEHIND